MKRSAAVPLTVAATLSAGALAACGGPREQAMQCVDKTTERVVPDSVCARAGVTPGGTATGTAPGTTAAAPGTAGHGGGFPLGLFAWYYGGRVAQGLVSGGSYAPVAGARYRSPAGYVRSASGVVAGPRAGARGGPGNAAAGRAGVGRGGFGATGAGRASGA